MSYYTQCIMQKLLNEDSLSVSISIAQFYPWRYRCTLCPTSVDGQCSQSSQSIRHETPRSTLCQKTPKSNLIISWWEV